MSVRRLVTDAMLARPRRARGAAGSCVAGYDPMPDPSRDPRRGGGWTISLVPMSLLVLLGTVLVFISTTDFTGRHVPAVALNAYRAAAAASTGIAPGCRVDWTVLAAIGKVESDHGRIHGPRTLEPDGTVSPPIIGPALDGTNGTQAIPDTDGGRLDGDATWDHAVGPMQFIPATWRELASDGNGDGVKDPQNLYDAVLTAAAHLCLREPGNYADEAQLRRALMRYNASAAYVDDVLRWVELYRTTPEDQLVLPSGA
jgi:membrane-bound lytic murein transglycosylase B